jgi:exodeoxyribonuclease V alpha subunit
VAQLTASATKLLEIAQGTVEQALSQMITSGTLLLETIRGESLIFMPHLRRAEAGIATKMRALVQGPSVHPPIDFEKAVQWCECKTGKILAPSQRDALQTVLTCRVVTITGGPGVGKTTLLNSILTILRAKHVRCRLCAPTGRAAKRLSEATGMEAKTIHRLLEVQPATGRFARNESDPLDCDLLVMDEASMVDVLLMHSVLKAVPLRGSVILVGDVDQLPSVGAGNVLKDLIDCGRVPVVRLTEVFRQAADSQIIVTAHRIRRGLMPELGQGTESEFHFIARDEPERAAATLGQRLQRILNPPKHDEPVAEKYGWRFQIRDKVIQTENNYEKEVFNGDIGTIESINTIEHEVSIRFDSRLVTYAFSELDELSLAYAVTIHKSQGSEFPAVIPLSTQHYVLLQRNLIYTGITRGKKLVVLIGQRKALGMAVRNDRTQRRYSGLLESLMA